MTDENIGIDRIWEKLDSKMRASIQRSRGKIPYTAINGIYNDMVQKDITWWTNGFWPGMLWLLYEDTGYEPYRETAEHVEKMLDRAFQEYDGLHHDVGFMWHISAGMDYRLTGSSCSRLRVLYAANLLAGRFNPVGGYLRAWNNPNSETDNAGWAIIDSMMNISLLYWASKESGDKRYANLACIHADKTLKNHVRADGSVRHIVEYNPDNGDFICEHGGQGYAEGSSWSRGQAWGLYGFTLAYLYTEEQRYLNTAKQIANYFIACVCNDWLPRSDFRSPHEPVIYDSTAGMIAACGLLELADCLGEDEGASYQRAAISLLKAADQTFCNWEVNTDAVMMMGTESYHGEKGRHIPIIYGDYFLAEALYKLRGNKKRSW